MKKIISTAILVGGLTMGGATFADSVDNKKTGVDELLFHIFEGNAQLTKNVVQRVIVQDRFTENRLDKIETVIETGEENAVGELVEDIDQNLAAIENIVDEAAKIGEDITELEEVIAQIIVKRSQNLLALLERDNLPEQAKAGIRKALANQERAMARVAKAKDLWKSVEEAIAKLEEELVTAEEVELVEETIEVESDVTTELETEEVEESNKHVVKTNEKVERTLTKAAEKIQRTEERATKHLEKGQTKAHEKALEKIERTQKQAQEKVERTLEQAAEKGNKGNKGNKDNKGNGQGQGRP
ncbi:hypothetical protein DS745_09870 [Anaerobacillus alkaliphilus]|uniref:DUF5667 domain-containing protein n=1 Tax=Anaerobacillus alkaliphilus TaxID=1548597 RepID=A0A4V1LGI4_9BACI|nr:hypothetical protein [Anaerobacillus alkaliphilus]RXJ01774.1 hypothetical protein DS745_09870 [Anaerobacillus alkaliphilus]